MNQKTKDRLLVVANIGAFAGLIMIGSGCTQPQIQQASQDAATVQAALNQGCAAYAAVVTDVNAFGVGATPQGSVIEGFGAGACIGGQATAALVQKALSDPTTQTWLANLASQLKAIKV